MNNLNQRLIFLPLYLHVGTLLMRRLLAQLTILQGKNCFLSLPCLMADHTTNKSAIYSCYGPSSGSARSSVPPSSSSRSFLFFRWIWEIWFLREEYYLNSEAQYLHLIFIKLSSCTILKTRLLILLVTKVLLFLFLIFRFKFQFSLSINQLSNKLINQSTF